MHDWHTGQRLHNGMCDIADENGVLMLMICKPYSEELRRWQKELNHVTVLDANPLGDTVELLDVFNAAMLK